MDDVGAGPVCLDTAPFIYFIEEREPFLSVIQPLFSAVDHGHFDVVT